MNKKDTAESVNREEDSEQGPDVSEFL
jgi:hypothetical protein